MNNPTWLLPNATKDPQSITSDWEPVNQGLIHGVSLREVKNIPKANGHLTEIFRSEWLIGSADSSMVDQVFQVVLSPGGISAWHAHATTTDRLFVNHGLMRVVLYDARSDSPTFGRVNEFKLGDLRPGLLTVPPQVWHGVQNVWHQPALLLNLVDKAYRYEDPDHWRLPHTSPDIPFRF